MNTKDLENINWVIANGQSNERMKLFSLLSQVLEVTSTAMLRLGKSADGGSNDMSIEEQKSFENNQALSGTSMLQTRKSIHEHGQHNQNSLTLEDVEMSVQHTNEIEIENVEEIVSEERSSQKEMTISNAKKRSGTNKGSSINTANPFNLKELLESDACLEILSYYKENNCFDDDTRIKLMRIMCEELLKGDRVSNDFISKISSEVCFVFTTESKIPYFNQIPGRCPTGVFYDMYKNRLKKLGAQKGKKNPKKRKADSNDDPAESDDLDAFSDQIKESINYFKTIQDWENADFKTVSHHWAASYSYRRAALRNVSYENVEKTLQIWPISKTNFAFDLINFDFDHINGPLCSESFGRNWDSLKQITKAMSGMISNKEASATLATLPSENTDYDDVVVAKSLHYLVPCQVASTTVRKWTPTMEKSEESFFRVAGNELEKNINSRRTYEESRGIESTPIIFEVNVGSGIQYVVVHNELRLYFNKFIYALDAAFKLFSFFNMPFPRESIKFWAIINALLYKIQTDYPITGRTYSIVQTLEMHIQKSNKKSPPRASNRSPTTSPDTSFSE